MSRIRLMWQLYPSFLAITIVALIFITWYTTNSLEKFYLEQASLDLESRTVLTMSSIEKYLETDDFHKMDSLCKYLGDKSETRITIILARKIPGLWIIMDEDLKL